MVKKTPFSMSRRFLPKVLVEGGKIRKPQQILSNEKLVFLVQLRIILPIAIVVLSRVQGTPPPAVPLLQARTFKSTEQVLPRIIQTVCHGYGSMAKDGGDILHR